MIKDNPIKPVGLFHTPANVKELQDRLASYTGPGESALAQTAAFMAWNLASKIIDEQMTKEARQDSWQFRKSQALQ